MKNLGITLFLVMVATVSTFGQFKRQREYSGFFDTYYYRGPITFTVGAGITTYRGDLTKTYNQGFSYAFSIGANYKLWPHIVFGTELTYVNLQSVDGYPSRNISFVTSGFEFQGYGRLYLIDEIVRIAQDRKKESHYTFCKPYIQAGIGGYLYNAKAVINSPSYLSPNDPNLIVAPHSSFAFAIPAGMGLQFTLSQRSSICAEYIYRFVYSDYLDGVSTGVLTKATNDGYGILMVKVQYAPSAPKGKKRKALPPPVQYDGPKGTETWKTKKQQQNTNTTSPEVVPENNNTGEEQIKNTDQEVVPAEGGEVVPPQDEQLPPATPGNQ